jgi:SAM-dependent methyltransferase
MGEKASFSARLLVPAARKLRTALYQAMAPVDYAFRAMNQLKHYPPLHLRKHVGGTNAGFNGPGYEFVSYLRLLGRLRDGDSLWDIGCGCGMLELALEDLGWQGRLIGTDIHKPCIEWAERNIARRMGGHRFIHMDIYNAAYWRKGRLDAQQWLDGFGETNFDAAIAKSLFTHILPDELGVYLKGIADRLKPGGKALLTFFLLTKEEARTGASGRLRLVFQPYGADGTCSVRNPHAPTAAVAYEQDFLMQQLRHAGFTDAVVHRGVWRGEPTGLSFQDIVVAHR